MPRRRAITDAQLEALLALPTAEPDLIRHYTLSPADLAVIARRRRPHNRLGFAIQLCALRFPGRLLQPGEVVPREVLVFVADQLDLPPDVLADYAARPQTRYDQLDALYSVYGFQTFTRPNQHELAQWMLPVALTTTSGAALAGLLPTDGSFRRAERRAAEALQTNARAVNDKIRLLARVGDALIEARNTGSDAFAAIETVLPWDRFAAAIAEAKKLSREDGPDYAALAAANHAVLRRFGPLFLDSFGFEGVTGVGHLLRAIEAIRVFYAGSRRTLPKNMPIGFIRRGWRPAVFRDNGVDVATYELCLFAELRDRRGPATICRWSEADSTGPWKTSRSPRPCSPRRRSRGLSAGSVDSSDASDVHLQERRTSP